MSDDKLKNPEKVSVKKPQCIRCGEPIRPLPPRMVEKIYGEEGDVRGLTKMCQKCRRKAAWEGGVFKL